MTEFETTGPIVASIEQSLGEVYLIATDRTETLVSVNPSDQTREADVEAAQKTVVDYHDGLLHIKVPKPRGISSYLGLRKGGSVDITVELPEGSEVKCIADYADFRAKGRLGEIRVKTGAGNIWLDHTGPLDVKTSGGRVEVESTQGRTKVTASGDLRIGEIQGDGEIQNLNGETLVGEVTGRLRVKSANGNVTVDTAGSDVNAKTANGNIRIGHVVRGSVVMETAYGGLEVGIADDAAAWIDADTKFGRIRNDLSPTDQPNETGEAVEVRARTAYGDIEIHRG